MNYLRTAMLLAAMTALFLFVGFMVGGEGGIAIAFVLALGLNAFAYWNSDKMVLRMYGAREVDVRSSPSLHGIVQQLAANAELPMPRTYIIENDQPNAFATGRNPENAAVAATTGLLDVLTKEEAAAVIAHELAHIKNRDTLIMTMTATIAGAIRRLPEPIASKRVPARRGGAAPGEIPIALRPKTSTTTRRTEPAAVPPEIIFIATATIST